MRSIASLCIWVMLVISAVPVHPQLGAPLGRCGPHPPDPDWPQNKLPPPQASAQAQKKFAVDKDKVRHDAQELAELSASIPADVDRVNRGLLPKDVLEKLKRVEKLSKQLRNDLTR
jgi:hypothetical protein